MSDAYRMTKDPLFLGLTRPAMILGVNYMWFVFNAMICGVYFINTSDLVKMVPAAILIHVVGLIIFSKEPRFIDILMIKTQKCTKCKNIVYHGYTHSYDPF